MGPNPSGDLPREKIPHFFLLPHLLAFDGMLSNGVSG
jgi:hypothetical protein